MSPPIPVSPYLFYQSLAFDDRTISYGIVIHAFIRVMKSYAWSYEGIDPVRSAEDRLEIGFCGCGRTNAEGVDQNVQDVR